MLQCLFFNPQVCEIYQQVLVLVHHLRDSLLRSFYFSGSIFIWKTKIRQTSGGKITCTVSKVNGVIDCINYDVMIQCFHIVSGSVAI